MRIAQVAPLIERVPPPAYGGTELVVSLLTDELVRRGHEVTLFATGDSQTLAKLEAGSPTALRGMPLDHCKVYETLQLSRVFEQAEQFDIIHSHVDLAAFPFANLVKTPTVHTIHGVIPTHSEPIFAHHRQQPFVSISHSQRREDLGLNYVATVYNGIDHTAYEFHPEPDSPGYLAFLGRMSPEKGPDLAIQIAQQSGWTLKLAGKVDVADRDFFEAKVKPLIDGEQIIYLGEANQAQKSVLMGGAVATLFPITWQEPFGLVMIESMVCGTPVIAMRRGSAPEIIAEGKTGFLCQTVEECVAALDRVKHLDRASCRDHVIANFSAQRMTDGYEAVYRQVLADQISHNGHRMIATLPSLA